MFKLLSSVLKRVVTAVTNSFRMLVVRAQRLFNVNILTAKLIPPLTKKVKSLVTLKPQSPADYFSIGRYWVYKKLFLTLVLALCAGVFLYFSMFAEKLPAQTASTQTVMTTVTFDYDDLDLAEYTGVANIRAADGTVVYTGDVAAGVCTGNGTLRDRKGRLVYEGGFENNQYSGQGVQYWPSGNRKYEGEFKNNQYSGEGVLYAEDGETVLYTGGFQNGRKSGTGKAYSETGTLLYEGVFAEDQYHGEGTQYYDSGVVAYTGQFFEGQPQGQGTLYSAQGRALYIGPVYEGKIQYSALVGATLADLEAAFTETPRIYYTEDASVFLYEEAGVVVTMDCRVKVDVWENEAAGSETETYYYLPSAAQPGTGAVRLLGASATVAARPLAWIVTDDSSSSSSSASSSASSDSASSSSSSSASSDAASSSASSQAPEEPTTPEFIQKNLTLYFEIDSNVWQAEEELDKTKVFVQKATVCGDHVPLDTLPEEAWEEDRAPAIEDCVAIRQLRTGEATAFSNVTFQLDEQNKLFVAVSGINYANQIQRRVLEADGLVYEYCYPYQTGTVLDDGTGADVMYYSIRKG